MEVAVTFLGAVGQTITEVGNILALFTKEPTVYFTAAAFVGVVLKLGKRLIPMKR